MVIYGNEGDIDMKYYNKLLILAILAGLSSGCNPTSNKTYTEQPKTHKSLPTVGWYMRTTVQAIADNGKTYRHNDAGVFGELDESSDGLDKHDIPTKGNAIIQIRFINNNLDSHQTYYSDYRHYDQNDTKKSWDFIVINDDNHIDLSNASIKLNIQNIKKIYRQPNNKYSESSTTDTTKRDSISIIDLDNQTVYKYANLKNANLNMDGKHIRKFRLVLGKITQNDMQTFKLNTQMKPYKLQSFADGFGLPPE
jgi:hypothetical protein